ncbi:hypothetical protein ILUMI_07794 [Ignelater luminosus]|uniref:DNA endonuclease activator Ctp1 C-terminal domain-containing protein n=1 Tax=Ignelater luminosus TaxID=2038154 RepID=A0A8K0D6U4_IGNLU|nr:hypothetical protein ILUMI_07794 [Ignelater luminosus]
MPAQSDDALEDWMSLFSEETESIWNTENKELRRVSMLMQVIRQEFKRVEDNLDTKVKNLKHQLTINEHLNRSIEKSETTSVVTPKEEVSIINKSPKLNKHRKNWQLKKRSPQALFTNQQKSNKLNAPTTSRPRLSNEDLFESSNTSLEDSFEFDINKPNLEVEENVKKKINTDIVDSSFVVKETPHRSAKKMRLDKKSLLKGTSKLKAPGSNTLTQMLSFPIAASGTDSKSMSEQRKPITNKSRIKLSVTSREEKSNQDISKEPKENFLVPPSFINDYDRIPVIKDKQPQHVHKTETVRCKADRMKLPGWSCAECKEYYEELDLPPEELHKKMNICSKHRNKFPPSNETIAGFWDVGMPDTQEMQDDDLTLINFESTN